MNSASKWLLSLKVHLGVTVAGHNFLARLLSDDQLTGFVYIYVHPDPSFCNHKVAWGHEIRLIYDTELAIQHKVHGLNTTSRLFVGAVFVEAKYPLVGRRHMRQIYIRHIREDSTSLSLSIPIVYKRTIWINLMTFTGLLWKHLTQGDTTASFAILFKLIVLVIKTKFRIKIEYVIV